MIDIIQVAQEDLKKGLIVNADNTVDVEFEGSGTKDSVSRSDHVHDYSEIVGAPSFGDAPITYGAIQDGVGLSLTVREGKDVIDVKTGSNGIVINELGEVDLDQQKVNKNGDTMTGALIVPSVSGLVTEAGGSGQYATISSESSYAMLWRKHNNPSRANSFIGINGDNANNLRYRFDSGAGDGGYLEGSVYHQHFKPTPSEIGALSTEGGFINGRVTVINNENQITLKKSYEGATGYLAGNDFDGSGNWYIGNPDATNPDMLRIYSYKDNCAIKSTTNGFEFNKSIRSPSGAEFFSGDLIFTDNDSGDIIFRNANGHQKGRVYTNGSNPGLILSGNSENAPNIEITPSNTIISTPITIKHASLSLLIPSATGGHARGLDFKSTDGSTVLGGVGYLGQASQINWLGFGFGANWYDSQNGFKVSPGQILFNNNAVYHAGNPPTAYDVGALSIDGGEVNGEVVAHNILPSYETLAKELESPTRESKDIEKLRHDLYKVECGTYQLLKLDYEDFGTLSEEEFNSCRDYMIAINPNNKAVTLSAIQRPSIFDRYK